MLSCSGVVSARKTGDFSIRMISQSDGYSGRAVYNVWMHVFALVLRLLKVRCTVAERERESERMKGGSIRSFFRHKSCQPVRTSWGDETCVEKDGRFSVMARVTDVFYPHP